MAEKPKALCQKDAMAYIGATHQRWAALKREKLVVPLPVVGSYSVKHLDALIEGLETELEKVIHLNFDGNTKGGRSVVPQDSVEGGDIPRLRANGKGEHRGRRGQGSTQERSQYDNFRI